MTDRLVVLAASAALLTCAGTATAVASASTTATAGGLTSTRTVAANPSVTHRPAATAAALPPTFCSAYLDEWDSDVKCPPLAAGTYTFENTSPGDDGVQLEICFPSGLGGDECPYEYAFDAPGDSISNLIVYSGMFLEIGGYDWAHHEHVAFSATYTGPAPVCHNTPCPPMPTGRRGKSSGKLKSGIERCKNRRSRCVAVTFAPRSTRIAAATKQLILKPLSDAAKGRMPDARLIPRGSTIHIDGYADNSGSRTYRQKLSLRQADTIRVLLQKRFGSRYCYVVTGHGSSDPVATNRTAAGRQRNRRVEISYAAPRSSKRCNPGNPHNCGTD
jgi:outer membrane protein OmpA-like peptidoglycan-associated protein